MIKLLWRGSKNITSLINHLLSKQIFPMWSLSPCSPDGGVDCQTNYQEEQNVENAKYWQTTILWSLWTWRDIIWYIIYFIHKYYILYIYTYIIHILNLTHGTVVTEPLIVRFYDLCSRALSQHWNNRDVFWKLCTYLIIIIIIIILNLSITKQLENFLDPHHFPFLKKEIIFIIRPS